MATGKETVGGTYTQDQIDTLYIETSKGMSDIDSVRQLRALVTNFIFSSTYLVRGENNQGFLEGHIPVLSTVLNNDGTYSTEYQVAPMALAVAGLIVLDKRVGDANPDCEVLQTSGGVESLMGSAYADVTRGQAYFFQAMLRWTDIMFQIRNEKVRKALVNTDKASLFNISLSALAWALREPADKNMPNWSGVDTSISALADNPFVLEMAMQKIAVRALGISDPLLTS